MKNPVGTIRLTERERNHLIRLKARTGLKQWNELCRWAFCYSLREATQPSNVERVEISEQNESVEAESKSSNVEMDWKTFSGEYGDLYWALLKQRCHFDGLGCSEEVLKQQFQLHLSRGIKYLFGDQEIQSVNDLVRKIIRQQA